MIIQPKLEVPANVALGLASGKFVLIGGTVRRASNGRIVMLLKDAATSSDSAQSAVSRAAALARSRGGIAAGVAGMGALATTAVVVALKRRRDEAVPECAKQLNASLRAYLDSAGAGTLDADVIDNVISDLDATTAYARTTGDQVGFSGELWDTLVRLVVDHTEKLAATYDIDVEDLPAPAVTAENDTVIDLRRHLEAQRRIVARAA